VFWSPEIYTTWRILLKTEKRLKKTKSIASKWGKYKMPPGTLVLSSAHKVLCSLLRRKLFCPQHLHTWQPGVREWCYLKSLIFFLPPEVTAHLALMPSDHSPTLSPCFYF
jgi:hypothetical protein